MNESQSRQAETTVRFASEEIERICDAFESAWKESRNSGCDAPQFEAFLADFDGVLRSRLLYELLLLEFEYREPDGDLSVDHYVRRMPEDRDLVYDAHRRYLQDAGMAEPDEECLAASVQLRLVKMHREGGLGQVWLGRDETIGRPVAIKEIRPNYSGYPEVQSRFLQEAELTGQLEHPGIVPVYALGKRPDGRPFYAMRLIQGVSLADALKPFHQGEMAQREQPQRLELHKLLRRFVDACDAIAYAHSRGILHRDLKPDNIMLGKYGETLVVDWGLAKTAAEELCCNPPEDEAALSVAVAKDSAPTQPGMTIGTPSFMSPEQAGAHGGAIGAFTDVFGLGATLYCILTGGPPYKGDNVLQIIGQAKKAEFVHPRKLKPATSRKLEAICLKAMSLRPEDRYPSAKALGDDVERWLADEPITAMPDSCRDRVWRWAKRNRAWVAAIVLVMAFVAAGSMAGTLVVNALRLKTQEARAEAERQLARAERALYATQVARAERHAATDPSICLELLNDTSACPEKLRDFAWYYLYRSCRRERMAWNAHAGQVRLVAFAEDAVRVIAVVADGTVHIWNTRTSALESTFTVGHPVTAAAICPSRTRLLLACEDGTIRIVHGWPEVQTVELPPEPTPAVRLALAGDGKHLASLHQGEDSPIVVWDLQAAKVVARFSGPEEATSLAFSADGTLLAAGGLMHSASSDSLMLWNLDQGGEVPCPQPLIDEELASLYSVRISSLSFGEDNKLLFAGTELGMLARINLEQGTYRQRSGHSGTIWTIRPGPRGSSVVFTAGVGTESRPGIYAPLRPLVLWNGNALEPLTAMAGVSTEVTGLDFHEETGQILIAQKDGILLMMDCTEQWVHTDLWQGVPVEALAFSADGGILVAAGTQPGSNRLVLRHWDPRTRQIRPTPTIESVSGLLVMPPGQILPSNRMPAAEPKTEDLVDALTGKVIGRVPVEKGEMVVAVSGGRRLAAVCSERNDLVIWNLDKEDVAATLRASADMGSNPFVAFSPSHPVVAWASTGPQARVEVWDFQVPTQLGVIEELSDRIRTVSFCPHGNMLAIGHSTAGPEELATRQTQPASVTLVDLPSCSPRANMKAHAGDVCTIAFSPDGRTLATGSLDWKVRLWDTVSAVQMMTMEHHTNSVLAVTFTPDGQALATAGSDGSIRLWRAATPAFVVEHEAWKLIQWLNGRFARHEDRVGHLQRAAHLPDAVRSRAMELKNVASSGIIVLQDGSLHESTMERP